MESERCSWNNPYFKNPEVGVGFWKCGVGTESRVWRISELSEVRSRSDNIPPRPEVMKESTFCQKSETEGS